MTNMPVGSWPQSLRRTCSWESTKRRPSGGAEPYVSRDLVTRRGGGKQCTPPHSLRKRHALVDTDGRPLVLEPHPADIQDRDGGGPVLAASRHAFPFIAKVFADSGYAGKRVAGATAIAVEIVRKNPDQIGFAVQPRRWVVERFF